MPRPLSLVKFNFDGIDESYHVKYPFKRDAVYVFFGDIPNMPGHCVVADFKTGHLYSGFHTENFVELEEEGY